jgi:hypothetical protein
MKIIHDPARMSSYIRQQIERVVCECVEFNVNGQRIQIPEMTITNSCEREMRKKIDCLSRAVSDLYRHVDEYSKEYFGESIFEKKRQDLLLTVKYLSATFENKLLFNFDELIKQFDN